MVMLELTLRGCMAASLFAGVAELADAHDSKSCGAIRAGSSPATGIKIKVWETSILSGFPVFFSTNFLLNTVQKHVYSFYIL